MQHIPLSTPYTNDRLQAAIERVARILGQDLTTQNPILNTRLPDGSRVAVVGAPSSINGPTLTIRKFNRWYTSDELVESGSMPKHVRDTVVEFIGQKKNGIISGGTGSGKTTLMKAFLDHIPANERLLIIEQPAELKVAHPNAVRWEAVEEIPGQVAITSSELLAAALRHRPDRIIMGEIRNECGYDLLQAMNTGHGGTLSTIHAKSAWDALNRLSNLALSARPNLNHAFMRSETAEAIDFVLYCERDHTGRRRVRELITVSGYTHADQSFQTEEVYRAVRGLTPSQPLENPTRIEVLPMHHHAPNSAAQPHLSLNTFSVPSLSREERNGSGERPSFHGTLASRNELWFGANIRRRETRG